MYQYIFVQGKKYYLYAKYADKITAIKEAKRQRKKNNSRYFITKNKEGLYTLWLNKVIGLWQR